MAMTVEQQFLPPLVSICIPPILRAEAQALSREEPAVHPVWQKCEQRGRHFVVRTRELGDIEEMADWARSWLEEPDGRLDKTRRQAFQNLVRRASRHVELKAIGHCHFVAVRWKGRR
jgi:hypothetical protein